MSYRPQSSSSQLGPVLIVGGCGFLGYHLVTHLQREAGYGTIHVLDVNVSNNRHNAFSYIKGNIADYDVVEEVVRRLKPRVIFHAASPVAALPSSRAGEYYETNVTGTRVLLEVAEKSEHVKALVYTSTCDVYVNPPHYNVDETHPLWTDHAKTSEYSRTKAMAQRLVLAANGPQLKTVCLLPAHMYGERHRQGLHEILATCTTRWLPLFRFGNGDNKMEVASADNTAAAHVVAAKALLDPRVPAGYIDGQAFNVSDGQPVPFWHHVEVVWKSVRGENVKPFTIAAWFLVLMSWFAQWFLWIFTLNMVKPWNALTTLSVTYCLLDHTYSIEKARERLGFAPVANHDEVLRQAVRWELNRARQAREAEPGWIKQVYLMANKFVGRF
ncbi:uncharacterized protein BCR38DRAFT_450841 [Pseudomassariella vexata]|uniref:3-beta hydroxysteroid dehydrogenase/isomerase domain-containing protein n=1 Tax=Pseudomassariella vexata TaxID=1141098 RepID=A0A1Y2DBM5_9PEZI|nr:uncharacterized protein BCR38DRAFT_450841 [Pseudomassariella vexata]ORY56662.1 hypothetical protein BCR38DRAFT_450841 [Pseudomassariella vexata]